MLAVFRIRSFRFQWPADLVTSWALEMETLILGWYVIVHTGSVFLLSLFGALQFLGTLAAPMFGVLGDRLGGRTVLCALRATYATLAALIALLSLAGMLTPVLVLVIAAVAGMVRPSDLVMRNTLIGETIPPAHRIQAIGLSRASTDSARAAGALTGAGLSALLGIGLAYVFVTSFYVGSLLLTFRIARRPPVPDPARMPDDPSAGTVSAPRISPGRDLKDGLVHVRRTPQLLAMMWLAFLINVTAYPVSSGLLPYVAKSVYHVDATGLGWLAASFSFGGLLGSITMAVTGGTRRPLRTILVTTVIWYALLLVFGHVRTLDSGRVLLLLAGFVQNIAMVSMTLTLLAAAGERFRGRVMGVRALAVYGLSLGLMASGAIIARIGFPLAMTLSCTIGLLFTLLIALNWRESLWREPERAIDTVAQRV